MPRALDCAVCPVLVVGSQSEPETETCALNFARFKLEIE